MRYRTMVPTTRNLSANGTPTLRQPVVLAHLYNEGLWQKRGTVGSAPVFTNVVRVVTVEPPQKACHPPNPTQGKAH